MKKITMFIEDNIPEDACIPYFPVYAGKMLLGGHISDLNMHNYQMGVEDGRREAFNYARRMSISEPEDDYDDIIEEEEEEEITPPPVKQTHTTTCEVIEFKDNRVYFDEDFSLSEEAVLKIAEQIQKKNKTKKK